MSASDGAKRLSPRRWLQVSSFYKSLAASACGGWLLVACIAQSGVAGADGALLPSQDEGASLASQPSGASAAPEPSANVLPAAEPNAAAPAPAVEAPVAASPLPVQVPAAAANAPAAWTLVGRFDLSNPNKPRFAWTNSRVGIRFTGTSLAVQLSDSAYDAFDVLVDGAEYVAPSNQFALPNAAPVACLPTAQVPAFDGLSFPGCLLLNLSPNLAVPTTYPVVAGLPPGEHTAWLTKRTEFLMGRVGTVQLHGFVLDAGASLLAPPAARTRRIEIIGDSSTVGYGAAQPAPCNYSERNSDGSRSMGVYVGDYLHADAVNLSCSGEAIYSSFFDYNKSHNLPVLYFQRLPLEATPYDFGQDHVDVVVLSAGGDDLWGANGNGQFNNNDATITAPARGQFVAAYSKFLADIRSKRPDALIVATMNFGAYAQDMVTLRSAVGEAVAARTSAGDVNVRFFEFFPANDPVINPQKFGNIYDARGKYNLPYGCDGHIGPGTARYLAGVLGPYIARQMNWTDVGF